MYTYENDANHIGAVTHTGTTNWTDFQSGSFYDQTAPDGAGSLDPLGDLIAFSWIQIDATAAASDVYLKLSPLDTVADLTAVALRIPAGTVFTRGLRALIPAGGGGASGVRVISIALAGAGDTIYISANFDVRG